LQLQFERTSSFAHFAALTAAPPTSRCFPGAPFTPASCWAGSGVGSAGFRWR